MQKKCRLKRFIFKSLKYLELEIYKPFMKRFKTKKLYKKSLQKRKEKYSEEILSLSNDLLTK